MKFLAAIAAAIALLAFAAGCGGGGGSTSGSSGSGDVAGEANAACASANQRIASLGTPEGTAAVQRYLEETEATVQKLQGEIAALDGSAAAKEYADALARSVTVLNEMANAARSENPDAVRELSGKLVGLHVGKLAEAAGFQTCAEAPGGKS
jgi:plasmid stabilization system protein ParE